MVASREFHTTYCQLRIYLPIYVIKRSTHDFFLKVHIFWEGHKILQNLPLTFVCMYCSQKVGEDVAKFCGLLRIYELYYMCFFKSEVHMLIISTSEYKTTQKNFFQSQGVTDCWSNCIIWWKSFIFGRLKCLQIHLKCMGLKSEANHLRENYWKLEKLLESEVNFKISVWSFCCAWLHYKMSCS